MNKPQILIIDDDQDYCAMVSEVLGDDFICFSGNTGKAGLDRFFNECKPTVVLVDLNLPDMDGFEICQALREPHVDHLFSIFVVSGDESVSSKIHAFDAGADDYISKPFELKELVSRINRSVHYIEAQQTIKSDGESTKEFANVAMAQASQYSYVMNFFKALNHCEHYMQVVNLFFEAMSFFKLQASILIKTDKQEYFSCNLSDLSPIEKNIYELLGSKGRLYEFGSRLMVNGESVSFLIKNLPSDEQEAGQARDFLAALIEGMEAKLKDLEIKSGFVSAVEELNLAIVHIKEGIVGQNTVITGVMLDMLTEMSASYHSLDLSEEQEAFFTHLIEQGAKKMNNAQGVLNTIQEDLEGLKDKMMVVQKASISVENNDANICEDVELF